MRKEKLDYKELEASFLRLRTLAHAQRLELDRLRTVVAAVQDAALSIGRIEPFPPRKPRARGKIDDQHEPCGCCYVETWNVHGFSSPSCNYCLGGHCNGPCYTKKTIR